VEGREEVSKEEGKKQVKNLLKFFPRTKKEEKKKSRELFDQKLTFETLLVRLEKNQQRCARRRFCCRHRSA